MEGLDFNEFRERLKCSQKGLEQTKIMEQCAEEIFEIFVKFTREKGLCPLFSMALAESIASTYALESDNTLFYLKVLKDGIAVTEKMHLQEIGNKEFKKFVSDSESNEN